MYVPSLRSAPATFLVSLASSFELDDFATLDEDAVEDEAVSFLSLPPQAANNKVDKASVVKPVKIFFIFIAKFPFTTFFTNEIVKSFVYTLIL